MSEGVLESILRLSDVSLLQDPLIELAMQGAQIEQINGVHWKNPPMLVGGIAMGYKCDGSFCAVRGANYKNKPGSKGPRCCMEEACEAIFESKGGKEIRLLIAAAAFQLDDETQDAINGTLPPCQKCRHRMSEYVQNGRLYSPDTKIIMQRRDSPYIIPAVVTRIAIYTLQEMFERFPL